ncbi:MAG: hypothetical protein J0M14_07170 [Candidatus Accumulibacter sp.]|nr:hypothetical protein [Accumulibacter sp.]MBO3703969.1 hypothetical protein [Accumulibacter sp.]
MAQTELVEDVGVGAGEVGNGEVTENQPLVHRFVNHPAADLLVGTQRFQPRGLDGRRDQVVVNSIEIGSDSGRHGFLAEGHEYET